MRSCFPAAHSLVLAQRVQPTRNRNRGKVEPHSDGETIVPIVSGLQVMGYLCADEIMVHDLHTTGERRGRWKRLLSSLGWRVRT